MHKLAAILLVCAALTACSASRRISRIAERHGLTREATITIRDTVAIPMLDTVYIVPLDRYGTFAMRDTAQKISVSGLVDGDSVILCVRRYTDTVIVEKQIPYKQIVVEKKGKNISTGALVAIVLWLSGFLSAVFYKLSKL